jgi:hypothetical protein
MQPRRDRRQSVAMRRHQATSRVEVYSLVVLILGSSISTNVLHPATAATQPRARAGVGSVSVRFIPDALSSQSGEQQKTGRDYFGRDRATMSRFYNTNKRRGTAILDPYGVTPLRFRITNGSSVPITVRFVDLKIPRKQARGRHNISSVEPRSIRVQPQRQGDIVVGVAPPKKSSGTATFRFETWAAERSPKLIDCRVRYQLDPYSE